MAIVARKKRKKSKKLSNFLNKCFLSAIILFIFVEPVQCYKFQKLLSRINTTESDLVATAISDIIQTFYVANDMKFDFLIYGETSNHINDVINGIKKKISEDEIPIKTNRILKVDKWDHKFSQSAIIFIKSRKDLVKLHQYSAKKFSGPTLQPDFQFKPILLEKFKFFVYVQDINTAVALQTPLYKQDAVIKLNLPTDLRHFEFFLVKNQNSVALYANVLYTEKKCHVFQQEILNTFNGTANEWNKPLENFDHFSNYHRCNISFYCSVHNSANSKLKTLNEVYFDKKIGMLNEILMLTAKRDNFTLLAENFTDNHNPGEVKRNNQLGITIAPLVYYDRVPSKSEDFQDKLYNYVPLDISYEFYFLATQNDLYSNYEKLLMPFDDTTWILFFVTFGVTLGVTFVLRFCPRSVRMIVIGRGVNNPVYNAASIFFGISQSRVPRGNLSRFVLLQFLWFCLMFRTCYQSMMFQFMTTDMRHPMPDSIEDIRLYNYTMVANVDTLNDLNGIASFEGKLLVIHIFGEKYYNQGLQIKHLINHYYMKLYKEQVEQITGRKYVFWMNHFLHAKLNDTYKRSLIKMEHEKTPTTSAILMMKHNQLFLDISESVNQFAASGIIKQLYEYSFWCFYKPADTDVVDPRRILSLTDLEFGFVIWLCCLPVVIFVFLCELVGFNMKLWLRRKLRISIGLFDFLNVLSERLYDYHDRW